VWGAADCKDSTHPGGPGSRAALDRRGGDSPFVEHRRLNRSTFPLVWTVGPGHQVRGIDLQRACPGTRARACSSSPASVMTASICTPTEAKCWAARRRNPAHVDPPRRVDLDVGHRDPIIDRDVEVVVAVSAMGRPGGGATAQLGGHRRRGPASFFRRCDELAGDAPFVRIGIAVGRSSGRAWRSPSRRRDRVDRRARVAGAG